MEALEGLFNYFWLCSRCIRWRVRICYDRCQDKEPEAYSTSKTIRYFFRPNFLLMQLFKSVEWKTMKALIRLMFAYAIRSELLVYRSLNFYYIIFPWHRLPLQHDSILTPQYPFDYNENKRCCPLKQRPHKETMSIGVSVLLRLSIWQQCSLQGCIRR